jgi:aryl sulfotransferase
VRRYRGYISDSARWEKFQLRPGDVIISTPSKSGTTWMQTIVGMLLRNSVDLPPISTISPWLDMQVRSANDAYAILDAQTGRRFIKTHTPLDGVPFDSAVTYITVIRHPLDVAMSDRDHMSNMDRDGLAELVSAIAGEYEHPADHEEAPEDPGDFLRWFIDNHEQPTGSGPYGLDDYCQQVRTYWEARDKPNVHLFHYADMWSDLDGEMRVVADALNVEVDEARWPTFVEAATLKSMRARASEAAPDAHLGLWKSTETFFKVGGTRDWASLLTERDLRHFDDRLHELAGDAYDWIMAGRTALTSP